MTDRELVKEIQRTGNRELLDQLSDRYVPKFVAVMGLIVGIEEAFEAMSQRVVHAAWSRAIDEYRDGDFYVFAVKTLIREFCKQRSIAILPEWLKNSWREKVRPLIKKSRAEPSEHELHRIKPRCALLLLWVDIEQKSYAEVISILTEDPDLARIIKLKHLPKDAEDRAAWSKAREEINNKLHYCRKCIERLRK